MPGRMGASASGFQLEWFGPDFFRKQLDKVDREIRVAEFAIQRDVKKRMSEPGTGRTYRSRGSSRDHVASAPGHAPAVDLGELRNGVVTKHERHALHVVGTIGVRQGLGPRAMHLEDPDGLNRPAFIPAYEAEKPRLMARLKKPT